MQITGRNPIKLIKQMFLSVGRNTYSFVLYL